MGEVDITRDVHGFPGPNVDVEAIERELANLWKAPELGSLTQAEVVPVRTSVLNLVVVASGHAGAARIARTVSWLSVHHPSRLIVFVPDWSATDPTRDLDAQVSTHCSAAPEAHVAPCFERVIITVPPGALDLIVSVIPSLVLPDLPTFLWWPEPPPLGEPNLVRLARAVDRLVVDSRGFTRAAASLVRLHELCRQLGDDCALSDLNWACLAPWRTLTAQAFDVAEHRWVLDAVTRLTVQYGYTRGAADSPAQALLFVGWVTSRLGWEVVAAERANGGPWRVTARRPDGAHVAIELHRIPAPPAFNGALLSGVLQARDGRRSGEFRAERVDDLETIRVTVGIDGVPPVSYAMRSRRADDGSLLMQELRSVDRDGVYEEALTAARRCVAALGKDERARL